MCYVITNFLLRKTFPFPHSVVLDNQILSLLVFVPLFFFSNKMPRLVPSEQFTIPVHQSTPGWDTEQLAVEKHAFPASSDTIQQRIAFIWTHANGFSKEMMHPLMQRFATQLRSLSTFQSTTFDFYGFDARYAGDSARLNKDHRFNPGCKNFL